MSTQTLTTRNPMFTIGWIALLVISTLAALNHITLMLFYPERDQAPLFLGWAAFNLYSTLVLYIPFRRGERWAWYASWILVFGFAAPMLLSAGEIGIKVGYLIAASVMALCLLLTGPAFFRKET